MKLATINTVAPSTASDINLDASVAHTRKGMKQLPVSDSGDVTPLRHDHRPILTMGERAVFEGTNSPHVLSFKEHRDLRQVKDTYVNKSGASAAPTGVAVISPLTQLTMVIFGRMSALHGLMGNTTRAMAKNAIASLQAQSYSNDVNTQLVNLQNTIDSDSSSSDVATQNAAPYNTTTIPDDVTTYINNNQLSIPGVTGDIPSYSDQSSYHISNQGDGVVELSGPGGEITFDDSGKDLSISVNGESVDLGDVTITSGEDSVSFGPGGFSIYQTYNGHTKLVGSYEYTSKNVSNMIGSMLKSGDFTLSYTDSAGNNESVTFANGSVSNSAAPDSSNEQITPDQEFNLGQMTAIKGCLDVIASQYSDASMQDQSVVQEIAQSLMTAIKEINALLNKHNQYSVQITKNFNS